MAWNAIQAMASLIQSEKGRTPAVGLYFSRRREKVAPAERLVTDEGSGVSDCALNESSVPSPLPVAKTSSRFGLASPLPTRERVTIVELGEKSQTDFDRVNGAQRRFAGEPIDTVKTVRSIVSRAMNGMECHSGDGEHS